MSDITICYLCDKELDATATPDHVIPNGLFRPGDQDRPKLPVHSACNNKKSKDDEWIVKQIHIRSSFNPEAMKEFSSFVDKAVQERPDAYVIGKRLHNYKLAHGMFKEISWGLRYKHQGQDYLMTQLSEKNVMRFDKYIRTLCKGLFIYYVPTSKPVIGELMIRQYARLKLKNKLQGFLDGVKQLYDFAGNSLFFKRWDTRILLFGSRVTETPDKGFLFVEFYSQFGILVMFN